MAWQKWRTVQSLTFDVSVRWVGMVGAEQRAGAGCTPYKGIAPTLRCHWLRAVCSCLSTRWPSSSLRFWHRLFWYPREQNVKARVTCEQLAGERLYGVPTRRRESRAELSGLTGSRPAAEQGWCQKVAAGPPQQLAASYVDWTVNNCFSPDTTGRLGEKQTLGIKCPQIDRLVGGERRLQGIFTELEAAFLALVSQVLSS